MIFGHSKIQNNIIIISNNHAISRIESTKFLSRYLYIKHINKHVNNKIQLL